MHKLTLKNTTEVIDEIQHYFEDLPDGDFLHRLHAIFLIALGWDCSTVAKHFHKSVRTIHAWVNTVNQSGIQALRTSDRPGRTARLSALDKEQLRFDLKLSPEIYGYHQATWDGILLSKFLKERYGVELKPRRCQYLFHELGFSLKRARKVTAQSSPEQRDAFKKTLVDKK
jgi:transposase